jgi:hypothetical protein
MVLLSDIHITNLYAFLISVGRLSLTRKISCHLKSDGDTILELPSCFFLFYHSRIFIVSVIKSHLSSPVLCLYRLRVNDCEPGYAVGIATDYGLDERGVGV